MITIVGSQSTAVNDFFGKMPRDFRVPILAATKDLVTIAEKTQKKGLDKKRFVKGALKALIDIPNFPDWIEDAAIDIIIDVLAALMFPLPAQVRN